VAEATFDVSGQLGSINSNLNIINDNVLQGIRGIDVVTGRVSNIDSNVKVVYDEIGKLTQDFHDFVKKSENQHQLTLAETRVVKIRQEIETKFGFHAETRRVTIGILQADDLELVRKDTITTATEELMLSAPGYWLSPCLVALAAWINDNPELADRAVREAIRRNDEKTSLLFALICRRADRKSACLKWVQRYLANQDEENLDRKSIIILDAFASGLFGADTEGLVSKQIDEWITRLSERPGFIERQTKQWSDAINSKRKPWNGNDYDYLEKYSKTYPKLQRIYEGAELHATIFDYFNEIFDKVSSSLSVSEQLDDILSTLCSEFDDEELPLRRSEKLNQFIIDYDGDISRAQRSMQIEESAFETHKDFTGLLTDAAMRPESSHSSVSTQKFAVALSRDWILSAYNDVVAKNRMDIPDFIEINIDNFNEKTCDGSDEAELVEKFERMVDDEAEELLSQTVLSGFEQFSLYGGAAIGVIGLVMAVISFFGQLLFLLLGAALTIAGIGLAVNHFSKKKAASAKRDDIENKFAEKREKGVEILRAVLSEVVDFRADFAAKDAESRKVSDFLSGIKPEQYIRKLSDSSRRIKTAV
jgi:hypothetical protein